MYNELQVQKSREATAARGGGFRPTVSRTETKAIVQRPIFGNRQSFGRLMRERLPQFQFDAQRDWWEAPIGELHAALEALNCNLSDGARAWIAADPANKSLLRRALWEGGRDWQPGERVHLTDTVYLEREGDFVLLRLAGNRRGLTVFSRRAPGHPWGRVSDLAREFKQWAEKVGI